MASKELMTVGHFKDELYQGVKGSFPKGAEMPFGVQGRLGEKMRDFLDLHPDVRICSSMLSSHIAEVLGQDAPDAKSQALQSHVFGPSRFAPVDARNGQRWRGAINI